jgi:internalin A
MAIFQSHFSVMSIKINAITLLGSKEAIRRITENLKSRPMELDLSNLGLRKVPDELKRLSSLRSLDISGNPLTQIPAWFSEMTSLQRLTLGGGRLGKLPEQIKSLLKLRHLSCVNSRLTSIPSWIRELKELETLCFAQNLITSIPIEISYLRKLTGFDLQQCRVERLNSELASLGSLRTLKLKGNPIAELPEEIIDSCDARSIFKYFRRITSNNKARKAKIKSTPLNEFKLVLVGRGGVGKTTLAHKLITGKFDRFERTDGIVIRDWEISCNGDKITAHLWDFGGQEIMHGTHRFFITSRSLYLVLVSARENAEDSDAEYWLSIVRSLAGGVPVIVVLNRFSELPFELNRQLLRAKFGESIQFVECDAMTDTGVDGLRNAISQATGAMPELRKRFPSEWVRIKNELPKQKCDWMSFAEFLKFCSTHGERNEQACEELAEFLHDLGIMLSYRNDDSLRRLGVLNPHWVTQAIYRIITAQELKQRGARVEENDLSKILDLGKYPKELHNYLLALMRKFELCFPLDDSGKRFLVPELLTKEEPQLGEAFRPSECLGWIYRYKTALPYGLIPRFIVQAYVHRQPDSIWRSGVILEWGEARALVRGDVPGRIVYVWVTGPRMHSRTLLRIIRTYFERIHESYQEMPVSEHVPVTGFPEAEIEYTKLLKYHRYGEELMVVEMGQQLGRINVNEILEDVGFPANFARRGLYDRSEWGTSGPASPVSLFISYSHKDETYRDELRGALTIYERGGELEVWDDTRIVPGQQWDREILKKLTDAKIIILLLSNDFIQSDYCTRVEMKKAIARDQKGACAVVPIVIRECRYDKLETGRIQAILPGGKPIKNHRDRDKAWKEVTQSLDSVIQRLRTD